MARASRRRDETRHQQSVALAVATWLLAAGLALTVGAIAYERQRDQTSLAVHPSPAVSPERAELMWAPVSHPSVDGYPVAAYVIQPLVADAPLPPGVRAWPGPGQAVVSPALAEELPDQWEAVYGQAVGLIGLDGLEAPRERRAYFRPAQDISGLSPVFASGFGVADGERFAFTGVGSGYAADLASVLSLTLGMVALAGLAALVAAVMIGADRRRDRLRTLACLGASRPRLVTVTVAEMAMPIVTGALAALATAAVAGLVDVSFPWLDAQWPAVWTRRLWPWIGVAVVLAVVIVVGTVALTGGGLSNMVPNRAKASKNGARVIQAAAIICLLSVTATIWVTVWLMTDGFARNLSYYVGAAVVMVTVGSLAAVITRALGGRIGHGGGKWGIPSALVGGRMLERGRGRGIRVCFSLGAAVILAGQAQLLASTLSLQYYEASAIQERLGTQGLEVSGPLRDEGVGTFLERVPGEVATFWVADDFSDGGIAVVSVRPGTAEWLGVTVGAPMDRSELAQWPEPAATLLGYYLDADRLVIEQCPDQVLGCMPADPTGLLLASRTGADLPVWDLKEIAAPLVPGGLDFSSVAESWLATGTTQKTHAGWAMLFGVIGLAGLALSVGLLQSSESRSLSAAVAPLSAFYSRRGWLLGLCIWQVALPVAATGAVAALCYYLLPQGLTVDTGLSAGSYFDPSASFAWTMVGAIALAGLGAAVGAAYALRRGAESWRPGTK